MSKPAQCCNTATQTATLSVLDRGKTLVVFVCSDLGTKTETSNTDADLWKEKTDSKGRGM